MIFRGGDLDHPAKRSTSNSVTAADREGEAPAEPAAGAASSLKRLGRSLALPLRTFSICSLVYSDAAGQRFQDSACKVGKSSRLI